MLTEHEILEKLGVKPGDVLTPRETFEIPPGPVVEHASTGEYLPRVVRMLPFFAAFLYSRVIAEAARTLARVQSWEQDGDILVVTRTDAPPAEEDVLHGPVARDPEGRLVVLLGETAWFVVSRRGPLERWMVVDGRTVQTFDLERDVSPRVRQVAEFSPPAPVPTSVEGATLPGWVDPRASEWLVAALRRRNASPLLYDRAVAVGLVARLAAPAEGRAGAVLEQLLAEGDGAAPAPVQVWAAARSPEELSELEEAAVEAANRLGRRLEAVVQAAESDAPDAAALARRLLLGRDDLECALVVLGAAGAGAVLAESLAILDSAACEHLDLLSDLPDVADDPRLRAVAWQEPLAWWGNLAAR